MPLLAVSLILLAGTFLRARSMPTRLPFQEAVEHLETLTSGGLYDSAIEFGDTLLAREGRTEADRAPVHLQLARARFGEAQSRRIRTADVGRQTVEHYRYAASHAQPLTAVDFLNMGRAFEWQGHIADALRKYEEALDRGVERSLDLRKHVLSLKMSWVETPPGRLLELVDGLLSDAGSRRLDIGIWAIGQKLELLETLGRLQEGSTLLTRNRERYHASDWHDRFSYLEAWLLYKTGHLDEAERYLRTLRNRVDSGDEVYAMTGWLLGRVVMSDDGPQRPQEALSFFSDVTRQHPDGPYGVASRIGSAEALAMLARHAEAIDAYRAAIDELDSLVDRRLVNLTVLRASLAVMAEAQRQAGYLREAVEYSQLAVALVDPRNAEQATMFLQQLAQIQSLLAAHLDGGATATPGPSERVIEASSREARRMFAEAGSTHLRIAQLNALNERVAAQATWRAAELYARAGKRDHAATLYTAFAVERPEHPLVARAFLRVGQLRQVSGQLDAAVSAYRECYRLYPRTLDGSRVLVPLAQCYLAMGPDYEGLAEKTLRVVLEDSEVFTPRAPEFVEALFLLGDVLNRRADFEHAIATLEEALERYPDDPQVWRARYLLADSYRKSGLALKAEIADARFPSESEQMRADSIGRFQAAQALYRRLIAEYQFRDPAGLNRLERVYLRHATLYEADCYFETQDYRRALKLYEEAAGAYRDTSSALAAYVQMINSYVFLGQPEEARAGLARALVLVDSIPDESFDTGVSPETREDWKRYFEWLGQSELF
ncbi:MAG: tetratricopeptide repeat protein [Phycisphaerales bacterium]|nr:MAG: tetratricopeptide repeat protein [Phycisphaerales bacterium]